MMAKKLSTITLLIPVKLERVTPLEILLNSLKNFNYFQRRNIEIVVVDDASKTREVEKICRCFPIKYLKTTGIGKSAALNLAVKSVNSKYLVFIDQDVVILSPNWLDFLVNNFTSPEIAYVSGKVVAYETSSEGAARWERKGALNKGNKRLEFGPEFFQKFQLKGVQVQLFAVGTNYAIRRKVFEEIGGYDERFGPGGLIGGAGADLDIAYKVLMNGYRAIYDPRAVIAHQHPKSLAELNFKLFVYGISDTAIHTKFWIEYKDIRSFFQIFYRICQNFGRLIKSVFGLYPLPPSLLISSIKGNLIGPFKYFFLPKKGNA